jgi:hypothetical protein
MTSDDAFRQSPPDDVPMRLLQPMFELSALSLEMRQAILVNLKSWMHEYFPKSPNASMACEAMDRETEDIFCDAVGYLVERLAEVHRWKS